MYINGSKSILIISNLDNLLTKWNLSFSQRCRWFRFSSLWRHVNWEKIFLPPSPSLEQTKFLKSFETPSNVCHDRYIPEDWLLQHLQNLQGIRYIMKLWNTSFYNWILFNSMSSASVWDTVHKAVRLYCNFANCLVRLGSFFHTRNNRKLQFWTKLSRGKYLGLGREVLSYSGCYFPSSHCGAPALIYGPDLVESVVDNLVLEEILFRELFVLLLSIVSLVFHIH